MTFNRILEKVGHQFFAKENLQQRLKYSFDTNKYFKAGLENQAASLLDKNAAFLPEAKAANVDCLVDMLSARGLSARNMNLLVVLRAFHYQKYR